MSSQTSGALNKQRAEEVCHRPFHEGEFDELSANMTDDGMRGTVMIAVSHIDGLLKGAITYRVVNLTSDDEEVLFSGFGPLATFSARIRIAYALGIIGKKTRHDLDLMREIRNAWRIAANQLRHPRGSETVQTTALSQGCPSIR
jgi:hypothetical protein